MKVGKYVRLIKKKGYGVWINSNDGEVYLATGASIYKAPGLPCVSGDSTIKAVLDIDQKAAEKILLKEEYANSVSDVFGYDLSDFGAAGESEAKRMKVAAVIDGAIYSALQYNGVEIIFYDQELLAPLQDKLNDKDGSAYISYAVREHKKTGHPYIVIKDGFQTLAAIMPVAVLSDDYISELQDFQLMCIDQLQRDKARALECARRKAAAEGKQMDIGDLKDGESNSE